MCSFTIISNERKVIIRITLFFCRQLLLLKDLCIYKKKKSIYIPFRFIFIYLADMFYPNILIRTVQRLIMINPIQNKSLCLHNICVCV